jgi:hypothetical protein
VGARVIAGVALLLTLLVGAAAAQSPPLSITVGSAAAEWRPFLRTGGMLVNDRALREALESGLPLRFRIRVELWEKALLDRLVDTEEAQLAVVQDPLDRTFIVTNGRSNSTYATLPDAERALPRGLPGAMRPPARGGRFYYLASMEVETLSLSDLEELQRWLRGEAQPAVQGRTPVGRAVGRGVQRAFVRMIGLPTRRYEVRSPTFVVE